MVQLARSVKEWLAHFEQALRSGAIDDAAALFDPQQCYWRDLVAMSWSIVTVEGREGVAELLRSQLAAAAPIVFETDGIADDASEGLFSFTTRDVRGSGYVRLRDGLCWTLLTSAEEIKDHEEAAGARRSEGIRHEARRGRRTWLEDREETARTLGHSVQPYCLIVGGGQGGLALAARLKRLNVPTLIVDALPRPGDSWRCRYKSLYLHDPVWLDHLPYMPFPNHWPVYMSKDKMGDWLEIYARAMELDIWSSTLCRKAAYDEREHRWTVEVEREGETVVLEPRHLILATGLSGIKNVPAIAGMESFQGLQYHSSEHPADVDFKGKRCVIVGANNSAHDIAVDLWEREGKVTMIQRSPTTVMKASSLRKVQDRSHFSESAVKAGMTVERADVLAASMPFKARIPADQEVCRAIQEEDAAFYTRLRATGFMLDFGEDDTGIGGKYPRRASGYYIDVGASDLIADGEVKVRSGCGVAEIRPRSVLLTNGEELPADVVVYATGYGPMNEWAELLISKEVADKVGPCWGLGSDTPMDPGPWEGELRNMWKPTAQEGLWFHGGNLAQSRFHSLHLALQLKARMEGLPVAPFRQRVAGRVEAAGEVA